MEVDLSPKRLSIERLDENEPPVRPGPGAIIPSPQKQLDSGMHSRVNASPSAKQRYQSSSLRCSELVPAGLSSRAVEPAKIVKQRNNPTMPLRLPRINPISRRQLATTMETAFRTCTSRHTGTAFSTATKGMVSSARLAKKPESALQDGFPALALLSMDCFLR